MAEEKFDAIIVGGGIAGCISAYLLAKEGLEVLIIERGSSIGVKNMSGGRIYAHSIEQVFPDFAQIAPIERLITHENLSFINDNENVTMQYALKPSECKADLSYSVLRVKFDAWLSEMAESAGASIVTDIRVDDLIKENGKICGVIAAGEEMRADVVIMADGANSTICSKYRLGYELNPHTCAVGVKEIIELCESRIEDIYNVNENEGAAWLFAGSASNKFMGGGFLYTNKTSISLGVVFGLHSANKSDMTVPAMLENFKNHPAVKPLIKNGKTVEYSAHIVPEGGLGAIKNLSDDGVIVVGDAAGLCLNVGYSVRGMDLAVESGVVAAKAVIKAKEKNDFSKAGLVYESLLEETFIMKDLKLYKKLPEFLQNERMFSKYPDLLNGIMRDLFVVNGPSKTLKSKLLPRAKEIGYLNILKDVFNGARSL